VHTPFLVLAEVSDKMMSFHALIAWNTALPLVTWMLKKKSRWLTLIPIMPAALFALGSLEELRDPDFGPAVIHELGYGYVALSFLPLLMTTIVAVLSKKRPNKTLEQTPTSVTDRASARSAPAAGAAHL